MLEQILYYGGQKTMALYTRWLINMDVNYQTMMPEGGKIIAPNHPTTIDPLLMTTIMNEQIHILVTESAFSVPFVGRYLRRSGHIPVVTGSGHEAYEAAKRLLAAGKTLAIFPEGALSPMTGCCARPHTGVARLALEMGVPVVPVGIGLDYRRIHEWETGVRDYKGEIEVARLYARAPYAVTVGAPLYLRGDVEDREYVVWLSGQIMRRITQLAHDSRRRMSMMTPVTTPNSIEMAGIQPGGLR